MVAASFEGFTTGLTVGIRIDLKSYVVFDVDSYASWY